MANQIAKDIDESIGRGIYSVGLREVGDAIERTGIVRSSRLSNVTDFVYVDTYETLYKAFELSAQASFRYFSGKASAALSMAQSIRLSSTSVYLMLRRKLITEDARIVNARLDSLGQEILSQDPLEFLKSYGDEFCNEIIFGAQVWVLVEIEASSEDELRSLRLSAKGSAGGVSGSVDANQKLERLVRNNAFQLHVTSIGLVRDPPLFNSGTESLSAYIGRLFEFFNNFENNIADGVGTPLQWNHARYDIAEGRTGTPLRLEAAGKNIRRAQRSLAEVIAMQDRIEKALANPIGYTPSAIEKLKEAENAVADFIEDIEQYVRDVFDDPVGALASYPFEDRKLPVLPAREEITDLPLQVTISGFSMARGGISSASGGEGELILLPLETWIGRPDLVSRPDAACRIVLELVRYSFDIQVGVSLSTIGPLAGGILDGLGGAGVCGDAFSSQQIVGCSLMLVGNDAARYTIEYQAAFIHQNGVDYSVGDTARDGERVGTWSGFVFSGLDATPRLVGLKVKVVPR